MKKGYFAYFQAKNRNGYLTNYPCYCVIPDQLGVNNLGNSNATLTDTVASPRIYGAIMSGYPYNQPADLGLETNKEAYYATRNGFKAECLYEGPHYDFLASLSLV